MTATIRLRNLFNLGAPQQVEGLTFTPVMLLEPQVFSPTFLTMEEALREGTVAFEEISPQGTVPEIRARNRGTKPVLVLDGEELVGAKQSRIANLSVMLPPESEIRLPVSCVEAGRWSHVPDSFQDSGNVMFASGRARKLADVSLSLRESGARCSDQSAVWADVSACLADFEVASPSQSLHDAYDRNSERLRDIAERFAIDEPQVGAILSAGGRTLGMDAFLDPVTWRKVAPRLIGSYAMDVLARPRNTRDQADGARDFLDALGRAESHRHNAVGLGHDLRIHGPEVAGGALLVAGQLIHICAFPARHGPAIHLRRLHHRFDDVEWSG